MILEFAKQIEEKGVAIVRTIDSSGNLEMGIRLLIWKWELDYSS